MSAGVKCKGILGLIFGHKWTYHMGLEWVYGSDHCTRCGYLPGGER